MYICPSSTFSHTVTLQRWVIQAAARIRLLLFHAFAQPAFDEAHKDTAALSQQAERLLSQHGDSILRLAYAYLHNMSDAEDVLQDTLLQFLKTAPVLENPDHEKAWLLRVAGNLSKNRIAYNRVRGADELEESLAAEQREDLSYVWDAVKSLPVKYREVIHLFYYEGYSTGQIAQLLRMNESTVRSRLRRGREQLKSILQEVPGLVDGL